MTPDEKRAYQRDWYAKNKDRKRSVINKYQQRIRQEGRELVNSLKDSCIVCGETEKCCLTFHHLNPLTKSFNLGDISSRSTTKAKILEEVEKCVVLCFNCHMKLHVGLVSVG